MFRILLQEFFQDKAEEYQCYTNYSRKQKRDHVQHDLHVVTSQAIPRVEFCQRASSTNVYPKTPAANTHQQNHQ